MPLFSEAFKKRVTGILLMALGALALSGPVVAGRWSLAILGIPLLVLSVAEAHAAFTSTRRAEVSAYLPSVLAMLAGNLLLLSSAIVLGGLLVLLIAILVIGGLSKMRSVWRKPPTERVPTVVNALIDFACAALLWYLSGIVGSGRAVGIIIGVNIAAAGWRMLMVPAGTITPSANSGAPNVHPKGELMPSIVSDVGIRPTWIARNTPPRVSIHMRSVERTVCAALSVAVRRFPRRRRG
jgi:uncharacterized membrane protein HdeD (DUF308 family)